MSISNGKERDFTRDTNYFYSVRENIVNQFKRYQTPKKTVGELYKSAQKHYQLTQNGKTDEATRIINQWLSKDKKLAPVLATMTQYLREASQEAGSDSGKRKGWHDALKYAVKEYKPQ